MRAADLARALERGGAAVETASIPAPRGGTEIVRLAGSRFDAVVAVGGDGTLREVVEGLDLRGPVVGYLPAGSGNTFAKHFAIPRDPARVAATLLEGRERRLDLGLVNGRRFVCFAGVGFDGAVVAALVRAPGVLRGQARYAYAIPSALATYRAPRLRVSVEGGPAVEASLAVVANIRRWGVYFEMPPWADPEDGRLEVVAFSGAGRAALVRWAARAVRKRFESPDVVTHSARRLRIDADPPAAVEVDGEAEGTTPVEFGIEPRAMRMILP
jgi:YegS/Rv2252/BmrU family lipid kinase